jgi:hypothetical protein
MGRQRYQPIAVIRPVTDQACRFDAKKLDAEFKSRFDSCSRQFGMAVFVLGDSHAGNIYRALYSIEEMPFLVGLWQDGCRPFAPKPECPYEEAIDFFKQYHSSISQVVFHVSGSHYILDHLGNADSEAAFVLGNSHRIAIDRIEKTADFVMALPKGPDIVWLGPFAEARVDLEKPENFSPDRLQFNAVSLDLFGRLDETLKAKAEHRAEFRYVSLIDALSFDADTLLDGDCITFADVDHLSSCGEKLFAGKIAETLDRVH